MWIDYEKLEALGLDHYLHGDCDDWVLENFQNGDQAIIWNEYNEDVGKVVLIHCYIKRGNLFLDIRGETPNEDDIEDGFDYGHDNGKIYCNSIKEYKLWIRKISNYKSKKWK